MTARGRPPHPDVLTPREWEVLDLLRRKKRNEEIAEQLGITLDGAKYHVSSILSKLGVSSREEAAAWSGEPAVRHWTPTRIAVAVGGVAVVAATIVGLALLGWGVSQSGGDDDGSIAPSGDSAVEIAFANEGGRLVLSSAIGTNQRVLDVACNSAIYWSPDGEALACASSNGSGPRVTISIVNLAGDLLSEFDADGGSFVWSPTSDTYAYTSSRSDMETDLFWGERSSVALASDPVWLPDGRLAAYRPAAASIGPEPAASINFFTGNEARTLSVGDYRPVAAVSGGSALLVAGDYSPGADLSGPTFDAAVLDLASQQLTPIPSLDNQPAIWVTADGRFGVYPSRDDPGGDLSVVDFRTLDVTQIAGSSISYPGSGIPRWHISFSPDQSTVYWIDVGNTTTIHRATLPVGEPELLGSIDAGSFVKLSPDLQQVAYIAPGNPPELWVEGINGSEPLHLGFVTTAFAWRPTDTGASRQ